MPQFQRRLFTCGPDALHNACNFLYGTDAPTALQFEDAVRRKDGKLDTKGTTEHDLKRALRKFEIPFEPWPFRNPGVAKSNLDGSLAQGAVSILYGRLREHWFVVAGRSGDAYVVIDAANEDLVLRWPWDKLLAEWRGAGGSLYAIEIWR